MAGNNDLSIVIRHILSDIRVEIGDEFDKNFERQGFFTKAWARRKSPIRSDGHILVASVNLRKSVQRRSDATSVTFFSSSPYAAIHNEGGEIKVTEKMKRYFWRKYYEASGSLGRKKNGSLRNNKKNRQLLSNAEFWKAMALMKVGKTIKIPKRQFLGMAPEVEREVTKIIEDELEEYFNHLDLKK